MLKTLRKEIKLIKQNIIKRIRKGFNKKISLK